jgi:hypothetical protein
LLQAEEAVDVVEQVRATECGKWRIEGFKEVFVEGVDESAKGDGFAHAGLTREQEYAASALDIVEPSGAFLEGCGIEDILGFDVFVEGVALEAEPGEEFVHEMVLPLWKDICVETFCGRKLRAFSFLSRSLIVPTRMSLS